MAFEAQDPDVPTSTANGYVSVAYFKTYCDDRGISYAALSDTEIQQAIVRATDYMDGRWTYGGYRYDGDQSTEVPRREVYDKEGYSIDGIPDDFKKACCEYAQIDSIGGLVLMPNSQDNTLPGVVSYLRAQVDVVEKETRYNTNKGTLAGRPLWPLADSMVKRSGLLASPRRTLGRG
jgi:hypothetical protein